MGRHKNNVAVKNNLCYLRTECKLTVRDLSEKTGISNPTISLLENEARLFRQQHVNVLCDLFQVTSDFLLGNNDRGIIVWNKSNKLFLTRTEYSKLKDYITTEYIKYDEVNSSENEFDRLIAKKGYKSSGYFYRTLTNEIDNEDKKTLLLDKLNSITSRLSSEEIEKVIKFIEDFILHLYE